MIENFLCVFDRHRPSRASIQWEGIYYTGECRRCGAKIVRRKGEPWRKDRLL